MTTTFLFMQKTTPQHTPLPTPPPPSPTPSSFSEEMETSTSLVSVHKLSYVLQVSL